MKIFNEKQYIRIGEIPSDEKSKIYDRIDNSIIGEELGVSVFEYIEGRGIIVPDNQEARDDFLKLMNSWWKPQYIVNGEEIGVGHDGEPLLKNVKIIKTLKKAETKDIEIEEYENSQESFYDKYRTTPPEYGIVVLEQCAKEADELQAKVKELENKLTETVMLLSERSRECGRLEAYNKVLQRRIEELSMKLPDRTMKENKDVLERLKKAESEEK